MGSFASQEMGSLSLDLDLLPASSSSVPSLPYHHPIHFSDVDKSLMTEVATNAMGELLRLSQTNEPFWMKSPSDARDVLDLESYQQAFPRSNTQLKNLHSRTEASRDSGMVIMNSASLVDMLMDSVWLCYYPFLFPHHNILSVTTTKVIELSVQTKWTELFPTIVSIARTIEVISTGMLGSHSGSLQLVL